MSLDALKWAFDQDCNGDATTKFVLVALCNWANEAWEAYPSIAGLAEKTCLNEKTVRFCLQRLVRAGVISDTGMRRGATKQIPVYHINSQAERFDWTKAAIKSSKPSENGSLPKAEGLEPTENGTIEQGKTPVFTGKDSLKRITDTQGNHKREKEKKRGGVRNAVKAALGFDEFWSAYPKRKAKADAEKAWAKLNPDAELKSLILAAVETQRTSADWQRDAGQFIPHPATWLNGRQWENEESDIRPTWTPEQSEFIEALDAQLGELVVAPTEWTAARSAAINGMLEKLGHDHLKLLASLERMRERIDPAKFGMKTFDWWAESKNRDLIRAGVFDRAEVRA